MLSSFNFRNKQKSFNFKNKQNASTTTDFWHRKGLLPPETDSGPETSARPGAEAPENSDQQLDIQGSVQPHTALHELCDSAQHRSHGTVSKDAAEEEPQTTRPSTDKEQHTRILTNHGEQLPL